MTSAPKSANSEPAYGPATYVLRSNTVMPPNGPEVVWSREVCIAVSTQCIRVATARLGQQETSLLSATRDGRDYLDLCAQTGVLTQPPSHHGAEQIPPECV